MFTLPSRRVVPHWEYPGGVVCLTWRVRGDQVGLAGHERQVVLEVIRRSDPGQCRLLSAVVMDDHVHVLTATIPSVPGRQLAATWKSVSSHELCRGYGRQAPLWQRNYFDRWMRSAQQPVSCAEYVIDNPHRRWPAIQDYPWVIDAR